MPRFRKLSISLAVTLILTACSTYVTDTIPPVIDLRQYGAVAVIDFPVQGYFPLQENVTRRYLAALHAAQPGVKILEIGSEAEVLDALGMRAIDLGAVRKIGEEFGVDAVLTGELSLAALQPSVSLNRNLTKLDASAKVRGALNGKVRETETGATAWTNGAHGTWTLGGFSMSEQGLTGVGMADVQAKYEDMLTDLVKVATQDFRTTYRRRRID